MKSILYILIVVVSVISFAPSYAFACSCMMPPSPEIAAQDAAVFTGKVTRIHKGTNENLVTFQVYEWMEEFTGMGDGKTVGVTTAFDSAACGYPFEEGKEYLVYAYGREQSDAMVANLCSRTTLLAQAGEDLDALGFSTSTPSGVSTSTSVATSGDQTATESQPIETSSQNNLLRIFGGVIVIALLAVILQKKKA